MNKLEKAVNEFWDENDLRIYMDPMDTRMIEWYIDKILPKLPELYRKLESEKLLPANASYQGFLQVFEFMFNKARNEAILGEYNER